MFDSLIVLFGMFSVWFCTLFPALFIFLIVFLLLFYLGKREWSRPLGESEKFEIEKGKNAVLTIRPLWFCRQSIYEDMIVFQGLQKIVIHKKDIVSLKSNLLTKSFVSYKVGNEYHTVILRCTPEKIKQIMGLPDKY